MSELTWDLPSSKFFESGVDRGAVYPKGGIGFPWNGLTAIEEMNDNESSFISYVDGRRVINQITVGTFKARVRAITYPDLLTPFDGFAEKKYSGQTRETFNLSFRSQIGGSNDNSLYAYRLHLVFNCLLEPVNREYKSLNDTNDILEFEWDLSASPVAMPNARPTAHLVLDSRIVAPIALQAVENILYGDLGDNDPRFPTIQELVEIFEANAIFTVVDNGDGTVTITGPDDWVYPVDDDNVFISAPTFNQIDDIHIFTKSY